MHSSLHAHPPPILAPLHCCGQNEGHMLNSRRVLYMWCMLYTWHGLRLFCCTHMHGMGCAYVVAHTSTAQVVLVLLHTHTHVVGCACVVAHTHSVGCACVVAHTHTHTRTRGTGRRSPERTGKTDACSGSVGPSPGRPPTKLPAVTKQHQGAYSVLCMDRSGPTCRRWQTS